MSWCKKIVWSPALQTSCQRPNRMGRPQRSNCQQLTIGLCSGLMLRLVFAGLSAVVLVVLQVGCGSGTAKPQTVAEYAGLVCGAIGDEVAAEDATWGEMGEGLDDYLEVMDGVEPLDSVRDWHNSEVAMLKSSRDYAKRQDADATINPFELLGEPGLVALALAYGAVVDDLSAGDLAALRSAGCEVD